MPGSHLSFRAIHGFAAIALVLAGSSSLAGAAATHPTRPSAVQAHRHANGSQDLYVGNIGGGVLIYSTAKTPQLITELTNQLTRVTGVWVDQTGVLYAYVDNRQNPYETIEEFQPGATSPFFSLVVQDYGEIAVADSKQNVYAQAVNSGDQAVIDEYPPGSSIYTNAFVVPSIGQVSGVEGLAFDTSGNLLVGVAALAGNKQGMIGQVFRLNATSSTFVSLNLQQAYGGSIATDAAGNLYVGGGRLLQVYAPGATTPTRTIHTKSTIVTVTAKADGTLYVDEYQGGIAIYEPGKSRSRNSFIPDAQLGGMAVGPAN